MDSGGCDGFEGWGRVIWGGVLGNGGFRDWNGMVGVSRMWGWVDLGVLG